jgi:hypothetical protein
MKEHPILFSGPMVRAILAGRKSQTRRVVKPKYEIGMWDWDPKDKSYGPFIADKYGDYHKVTDYAPWQPGDRLWVRETFADLRGMGFGNDPVTDKPWNFAYKADIQPGSDSDQARIDYGVKWKPSIHMPRAASRITLEVTDVRVERVQDITEQDAISEGALTIPNTPEYQKVFDEAVSAEQKPPLGESPRQRFARLWDIINAKKGYGWETNCWVWVIEFRRVDA